MEKEPKRRLKKTSKKSSLKAKTSTEPPKAAPTVPPQKGWSAQLPGYLMTDRKPPANQVPAPAPAPAPATQQPHAPNYGYIDG